MRKGLIATAVAVALFAVGAFAASFAVQSEDVASGGDGVVACATAVDITFNETLNASTGIWEVTEVTAKFLDEQGASDEGCDGRNAILALGTDTAESATVTHAEFGNDEVDGDTATFAISALNVERIRHASILVDGFEIE